jgi:excisionase family DNA binding protein
MPEHSEHTERAEWWLTLDEVVSLLRMSRPTIRRHIMNGELPGAKIGGQWRVSSVELGERLGRTITPEMIDAPPRTITSRYPALTVAVDSLEPACA